jgi:hypothetical protein
MTTLTCVGKVDYIEFEHDGKSMTSEAEFIIDIKETSAAPYPGYDYEATDYFVTLAFVIDEDQNEYDNIEIRGRVAEELFKKTNLELHTMYEGGVQSEMDQDADTKMREARAGG